MLVRRPRDCVEIIANDGCRLRELLHPERDDSGVSYSLATARVEPGQATVRHFLEAETEVYYIVDGAGRMHIGDEVEDLEAGDVVVIPPGAHQWIECTGEAPLEFLAIVSPPWRAEHDRKVC